MTALALLFLLFIPEPGPGPLPVPLADLPAVLTVYDPALGGINCDHDCSTLATGPLEPWMYRRVAACDVSLLGRTITFPALDLTVTCLDTGGLIRPAYSPHHGRTVLYFDILWPLAGDAPAPAWNYWLLEEWTVR